MFAIGKITDTIVSDTQALPLIQGGTNEKENIYTLILMKFLWS